MEVWTQVQVSNPKHEFAGLAGVVHAKDPAKPDVVDVKFDIDGEIAEMNIADLKALS